ncbi:double-stranded RNA-binding protein 1-like [Lolium perenne]|uniref:double-stranded RNA-binding protein 1-like n=1 Tax=Lolium perenne TaxID=4522 RepID=UPI003A98F4E2
MFRTLLQELSQQRGWASPAYTYDCEGPSHMPRFYATVAVNDAQFWADEGSKTVKEAKELAAKVALEHLSALLPPPPQQKPGESRISLVSYRRPCGRKEGFLISKNAGRMQQLQNQHGGTASRCNNVFDAMDTQPPTPTSGKKSDASKIIGNLDKPDTARSTSGGVSFSGIHVNYKSALQTYAQKNGKLLPSYSKIHYGPPHAPQFKSIVTIDGKPFESPQYYRTSKEAESAAAYAAIMSLTQEA